MMPLRIRYTNNYCRTKVAKFSLNTFLRCNNKRGRLYILLQNVNQEEQNENVNIHPFIFHSLFVEDKGLG